MTKKIVKKKYFTNEQLKTKIHKLVEGTKLDEDQIIERVSKETKVPKTRIVRIIQDLDF